MSFRKLQNKDFALGVNMTGATADLAKFKKRAIIGQTFWDTDELALYVAETTAGASDATVTKFVIPPPDIPANTGSLWFDGVNQYGTSAFDPSSIGTGDISVECWFKHSTHTSGTNYYVFSIGTLAGDYLAFYIDGTINQYAFVYRKSGSGAAVPLATLSEVPDNAHHQVLLVRSGTTIKIYIDGVEEYNITNSSFDMDLDNSCKVGVTDTNSSPWKGCIDSFRVWSADVSAAVNYLYDNSTGEPRPIDATADWAAKSYEFAANLEVDNRMEELTGTTVADASGNSKILTLSNGPTWNQDVVNLVLPDYEATKALQTDGSTDYALPFIDLNDSIGTGDFTIHARAACSDNTSNGHIFTFGSGSSNLLRLRNASADSKWRASFHGNGGGWQDIIAGAITTNDQFYDLTITRDFSTQTFEFFVDGVSQGTVTNGNIDDVIQTGAVIGAYENITNFFPGDIRTLSIWDEVLADNEITALNTLGDHDHRTDSGNYASQANLLHFLVAITKTGTMLDLKGNGHAIFQSSPFYVSYP